MHHKQQTSALKNNGSNSVVRTSDSTSNPKIINDHADSALVNARELCQQSTEPKSSSGSDSHALGTTSNSNPTPGRGRPDPRYTCEVARSVGYDPTGERAFPCGTPVQVLCEYCGPMCASCAEETFCYHGEHKLTPLPELELPTARSRAKRPVSSVVYVEIRCANCGLVRLALPPNHKPKSKRKCPVCRTKSPAKYLAHGFTRRRLPFHEVFPYDKEQTEAIVFKHRLPWDHRPDRWQEE